MPFREIPDAELNQPPATFREIPSEEVTFKETKPTITEEVQAAIPDIVSQLRASFVQPPLAGAEFTPEQLQAAEGFQPPRFREVPEIPFDSTEQPQFQQAGAQRTIEAAGAVAQGLGRTATFAAAVANAAAGTALGMPWETLQPQWERVKELGDKAPLEEISNVLSAGLLIYGGVEGLKAVPKLYTMAKNSNLVRKLTIPGRGLTTIPDKEMYQIYQTAPDAVKKEMATYNPQVRSILLDPAKVSQFSAQEAAAPEPVDPVAKFRQALREARAVRSEQEQMYTTERRGRFAASEAEFEAGGKGEGAYYSAIGKLKGEFEKKEFEAIRSKFSQQEVDDLIKLAGDSPLSYMDKVTVIRGVVKMLNGKVPQNNELLKMKKVYGKELVEELEQKRSVLKRGVDLALELANIPRAIKSGLGDMSAGLRQGIFFVTRKEWWNAWAPSFKSFWGFKEGWGEDFYNQLQRGFEQDPDYELMHDSGLNLTDLENPFNREETFQSNLAEKLPIIGRSIRASGRAYTAYLNKLRFDVWKSVVDNAQLAGIDMRENPKALRELSNLVNEGTGRGRLGPLEDAARTLNALIWSPRLAASRLILMGRVFNPNTYTKLDPVVRKEYLKSLLGFIGVGTGILGIAKLSGLEVGTDPTSADFLKIKIGNTRIGVFSNFPQWPRMLTQILTKKYTSSVTGKVVTLGEGYKPITRFDILTRTIESKEAPMVAYFTKLLKQQDAEGNPVSVAKESADLFIPIIAGDLVDLAKNDPKLIPFIAYSFGGGDVQTYGGTGLVGRITTFRNKIVSKEKREPTETEKFQLYQEMRRNPEDRKLLGDMTPRMFRKTFSNYTIGNTGEIGQMASALMTGDEDFKIKTLQDYEEDLSKDEFSKLMIEVRKNHIVSRKVIQRFYRAKRLNQ